MVASAYVQESKSCAEIISFVFISYVHVESLNWLKTKNIGKETNGINKNLFLHESIEDIIEL